jgi:hypothetical protein
MKVEFFDSPEAAAQRLRQAMEAADARVTPWQAALRPGDCILSIVEDGLVVFGECWKAMPRSGCSITGFAGATR